MERNYFLDTLFDIINESDVLESALLDIQVVDDSLYITMKDGTSFQITVAAAP